MILVDTDRDFRVGFKSRVHQVTQECLTGVLTSTCRDLNDHRALSFLSRFHDRLDLLKIVNVKRRHAVAVLSGVIEELSKRD